MSLTKRHAEKMGWFDDHGYHESPSWEKEYLDFQSREDDNPSYKDDEPEEPEPIYCLICEEDMSEEEHPEDDFHICHYCRKWNKDDGDFTNDQLKTWIIKVDKMYKELKHENERRPNRQI